MQFKGFDWLSGLAISAIVRKATIKLSSSCSCKAKSARFKNWFMLSVRISSY